MRPVLERGFASVLAAHAEQRQVDAGNFAIGREDGLEMRLLDV